MKTLNELFLAELQDVYDAEKQIIAALPKMEAAATSRELKNAFRTHLQETETQVTRLGEVFKLLEQPAKSKKCKGAEGIIKEAEDEIAKGGDPEVMDAFLIGAAQRVEHYEMAAYGTLRTWAGQLGMKDAQKLLQTTLDEEGATDKLLTKLAEGAKSKAGINEKAMA
jgi:ferritin-like metal-binding protein YciE